MTAGRPVLIVPYAGTFEMVGKRILFAWDGTREANRAMHDALGAALGEAADPEVRAVVITGAGRGFC